MMDPNDLLKRGIARAFRGVYLARRAQARLRRERSMRDAPARGQTSPEGARNILFVTVDQQRFDALSRHGGFARTPVVDRLAAEGVSFERAHVQAVTCMPSRSTMLTGQHPHTHGVLSNGIPLPDDAPSIAEHLRVHGGYRTAFIGKAHFDPHLDPTLSYFENRASAADLRGPWHGFEHLEFATHGPMVGHHYAAWLWEHHPEFIKGFGGVLTGAGGGDTNAPEVTHNPIPRELYHTDWIADRTLTWLREAKDHAAPWLCWMSFPDPHHPFDPPLDEVTKRYRWRDTPLPRRWPSDRAAAAAVLRQKPRHWLDWYEGRSHNPEGGPVNFSPADLSDDRMREIQTMIHVENELIDEALGRVVCWLDEAGLLASTDIIYTSDHGDLQGDFGLLFKGPYHVDSLLRVPLVWRPADDANIPPAVVNVPVGHVNLAATFCCIAQLPTPGWVEASALPPLASDHERVLTTFDSQFGAVGMHLRTICRDSWLCTSYAPSTPRRWGALASYWTIWGSTTQVARYDGSEGELYNLGEDPDQLVNLWDHAGARATRDALLDDLRSSLPPLRHPPLRVEVPT